MSAVPLVQRPSWAAGQPVAAVIPAGHTGRLLTAPPLAGKTPLPALLQMPARKQIFAAAAGLLRRPVTSSAASRGAPVALKGATVPIKPSRSAGPAAVEPTDRRAPPPAGSIRPAGEPTPIKTTLPVGTLRPAEAIPATGATAPAAAAGPPVAALPAGAVAPAGAIPPAEAAALPGVLHPAAVQAGAAVAGAAAAPLGDAKPCPVLIS